VTSGGGGAGGFGFADALGAIGVESRRLSDAVATADLDAIVPSCPEWSVRDLAHHIGRVQWFWGENVAAGDADTMPGEVRVEPPADGDLLAWLGWCTYSLLHALRDAGPDAPCWAWWDGPKTAGAVARHQAQEVSVHRWDAELAAESTGSGFVAVEPLSPEVATDGVPEFMETMVGARIEALTGGVTLTATDTGGNWQVGAADAGTGSSRSAELRAPASDLVLMLYRRLPVPDADVVGDPMLVASLLSLGQTR
jgi:uncharacterized protein (TIGR03083 family)